MRSIFGRGSIVIFMLVAAATAPSTLAQTTTQTGVDIYPAAFFNDARPYTAMDMINRLPGFSFDGGDQSRGFSGSAGNVLIDGQRPTDKTDGLSTVLSRIVAADVDHIEVIRGSAPGIDMQGKTVVANVVRKKGDTSSLVVEAQENLFADGHTVPGGLAEYSSQIGDQSYQASVRRDPFYNDTAGKGSFDVIDSMNTLTRTPLQTYGDGGNVALNGAVKSPLAGGSFGANLTLQQNYFDNGSFYNYPAAEEILTGNSQNRNAEIGANYEYKIGNSTLDAILLQNLAHSTGISTTSQLGQTSLSTSINDTGESIGRLTLRYPFLDWLTVEGGGEEAYNYLNGQSGYVQNGSSVSLPSSSVKVAETRGEVFGQVTWKIRTDLTLEVALRTEFSTISETGDVDASRSFFYPKPRALLSWDLSGASQLRFRAENVVGQLNFYDFVSSANLTTNTVVAGNPQVQPDQRWQYEADYEYHFWDKGALTLALLHQDISNSLDYLPVSGPGYIYNVNGNIGNAHANQISANLALPLDKIDISGGILSGSATFRDSTVQDPTTDLPRRISGEYPNTISVNFTQDLPAWKSNWSVYFYNNGENDYYLFSEIDHYDRTPTFGANWSYSPLADLRLFFQADNIFGVRNTSLRDIYSGPRDVSGLSSQQIEIDEGKPKFYFSIRKSFN